VIGFGKRRTEERGTDLKGDNQDQGLVPHLAQDSGQACFSRDCSTLSSHLLIKSKSKEQQQQQQ